MLGILFVCSIISLLILHQSADDIGLRRDVRDDVIVTPQNKCDYFNEIWRFGLSSISCYVT